MHVKFEAVSPHVLVACTDEWTPTQAYHSTGLNQCTVIHKFRPYFPGKYVEPGFNATVQDTLLQESYPYHYTKLPLTQNEFFSRYAEFSLRG